MSLRSRVALPLFAAALMLTFSGKATAQQVKVPLSGTTSAKDVPTGGDAVTNDEYQLDQDADAGDDDQQDLGVNRTIAKHNGSARSAHGNLRTKSNPEILQTMVGLNFFDQRFANSGNQFSVEPPDQALCVGNGYVVEATNDVFKVLTTAGVTLIHNEDLNTFYGYPAAINRTTGVRGPSITDPVCYYDSDTRQFYLVVLTFDTVASGAQTGRNHLDIAVTSNGDPSGTWNIYRIPTQNDGTEGTPDHGCGGGAPTATRTHPKACFPDYPHIGADAYGVYVSANEFPLFVNGFQGAEIYAFSKRALGRGDASINVSLLDTLGYGPDGGGFTVWPAQSPAGQYETGNNGTEYFMSSRAVFSDDGVSSDMLTWAITNTASLDTNSPSLNLLVGDTQVLPYAIFQRASQKLGSTPLGQCTTVASCAAAVGATLQTSYTESPLNANDSRIQQVSYANGKLWGSLDTGLVFPGSADTAARAGVAYFILVPQLNGSTLKARVANQGYVGAPFVELGYPTIAALANGRGVISFTLSGPNDFPSVAYASLDPVAGVGDIHVALAGAGPQDGFTGYLRAFGSSRPRWGDYGAAAVEGNTIWFAQEYVAQTCTFEQYLAAPLGQCGGTRGALGNYATGIVQVKLK